MFVKYLWVVDRGVRLGGLRGRVGNVYEEGRLGGLRGRVGNVCDEFMGGRPWS